MLNKSITIMVPAYNEEKYLESTISMVHEIVKNLFEDYEILIFNDHSSDRTGEIADALAQKFSKIKIIHNQKNMGLGYNFRQGARTAQKEYYCSIIADIDTTTNSLKGVLEHTGEADLITSFIANDERPIHRRFISKGFTKTLNLLFGLHLNYYCGVIIYKTELMKTINMETDSFAMHAEAIVQLIKKGATHQEYSYISTEKGRWKESNVFRLKNLSGALATPIRLFSEIYIKRN